jgi:hypothetical protein
MRSSPANKFRLSSSGGGRGPSVARSEEKDMSDCLHCDINELVRKHLEGSDADLGDLVGRMAESIADLILVAPEIDQANLMASAIASLGQAYLEKTGAIDIGESEARH